MRLKFQRVLGLSGGLAGQGAGVCWQSTTTACYLIQETVDICDELEPAQEGGAEITARLAAS